MSRTRRSFWAVCFCVFASVSYETFVLGGLFLRFCECLVRNVRFGRFVRNARFGRFASAFLECLVRNARFGRFASAFLRMSRTKRSFRAVCFCVFANVSKETLVLGGLLLHFCECLVRNARFQRFASALLRMSRTKRSFWAVCFCVFANVSYETLVLGGLLLFFANVSYETLVLGGLLLRFCECLA